MPRRAATLSAAVRAHPVLTAAVACVVLAALSLLLPSTPSYDPWAWIVWGREIAALELDTRYGPSWKPLPVIFTTPFSLFGEAAPELWLMVARAGALLGLVAAFRVARRVAGALGGALAAGGLALCGGYLRSSAIGFSEGILVALVLLAVERHLDGRRGQALTLAFLAGLLRPESWPFLGLYALYVFVRHSRLRLLAVGLMALLPILWLGPELWGAGDALRAASRAQEPTQLSPAFADRPALAVLARAESLIPGPVELGVLAALVAAALGLRRRAGRESREGALVTVALVALAIAWLALVAVMTELGYAGNSRYLALPVALLATVGGAGLGLVAHRLARPLERTGPGHRASTATAGALVVAVAAVLALSAVDEVVGDAREIYAEALLDAALPEAIARAGGAERVVECGQPYATALQVPIVAWHLRVPTGRVGIEPRAPGVLFRGPPGLQPPDAPAPAPTAGGLQPIARLGGWTVSARCP